jgi:hypothetical protein
VIMLSSPVTLAAARKYRYGKWGGNPSGNPFREGFCVAEVMPDERGPVPHQCQRSARTASPWCAIHKPGAAEKRAANRPPTRFEREMAALNQRERDAKKFRRIEKALRLIVAKGCTCAEIAKKALR